MEGGARTTWGSNGGGASFGWRAAWRRFVGVGEASGCQSRRCLLGRQDGNNDCYVHSLSLLLLYIIFIITQFIRNSGNALFASGHPRTVWICAAVIGEWVDEAARSLLNGDEEWHCEGASA